MMEFASIRLGAKDLYMMLVLPLAIELSLAPGDKMHMENAPREKNILLVEITF